MNGISFSFDLRNGFQINGNNHEKKNVGGNNGLTLECITTKQTFYSLVFSTESHE